MKELGSPKSVIFILTLPWDQGRKSHLPLKCSEEAPPAKNRELGQSVCA